VLETLISIEGIPPSHPEEMQKLSGTQAPKPAAQ
jgi:hypothetical protein